nr:hypothetical protein [uncultured Rhodopila sp.]
MTPIIKGSAKSITMWAAVALAVLSNIAPLMPNLLAEIGLHAQTIQAVGTFSAVLMAALRTITTMSLQEKGGNPPAPPSQN